MRKPLIVNIINTDDNSCKLVTIDISNNDANMTYARLLEQYDNRNFCNCRNSPSSKGENRCKPILSLDCYLLI